MASDAPAKRTKVTPGMATSDAAAVAALKSWVEYAEDSHFPVQNIPFGAFQRSDGVSVCATRIGDFVSGLVRENDGARGLFWRPMQPVKRSSVMDR
jgi:hypothetical protein